MQFVLYISFHNKDNILLSALELPSMIRTCKGSYVQLAKDDDKA